VSPTDYTQLPPNTNDPTQEMNPERNELKGKVPTRQQYRN